jgi:hypothetical protein
MHGSVLRKVLWAALVLAGASALVRPALAEDVHDVWRSGNSKAVGLEHCVKPTEWMRRNHMELIKHERNLTVHEGVRIERFSLAGCIKCHVNYDADHKPIPINSEGQFCDVCHEYAGADLDCFQCHARVPTPETDYGANAEKGEQR